MSYIVQSTRASSLTIAGADYTNFMESWQVSDSTVNGNGLLQTTGNLVLAQIPGGSGIDDYRRELFYRGAEVILTMVDTNGATFRHPRGLLYVLTTSYEPEADRLSVELGCRIALAVLTDEVDSLLSYSPVSLPPANQNIQGLANALYAYNEVLYQNSTGSLLKRKFFDGDSSSGVAGGSWVSVLGQTTISATPLAGTTIIPDEVVVSYETPIEDEFEDFDNEFDEPNPIDPLEFEDWPGLDDLVPDGVFPGEPSPVQEDANGNKYTVDIEVSDYFYQYPASVWERDPEAGTECLLEDAFGNFTEVACIEDGDGDGGGTSTTEPGEDDVASDCGNTPPAPEGTYQDGEEGEEDGFKPIPVSCNYGWETKSAPLIVPASATRVSRTDYGGPGQQMSRRYEELRGPIVETNPQYFADKHAYCVYLYGYACNPNGNCPFEGMERGLQSFAITENFFDESGELKETVRDTFMTRLSAAQTFDWRSGVVGGVPQDFDQSLINARDMYRSQRVVTSYLSQTDSQSVVVTTTYNSPTSRQVGIKAGDIDALGPNGIKTTQRRTSVTYGTLPPQPDSLASPELTTETGETEVLLGPVINQSVLPRPVEAQLYVLETAIPIAVTGTPEEQEELILDFSEMIPRWIKGDAYGMQITEALRREICDNWYPGKPFRYADTAHNQIIGMRMNATSWGVTTNAAVVTTDGVWTGYSSGTLNAGSNLVGNSSPDMSQDQSGSPTLPTTSTTAKAVSAPTSVPTAMSTGTYFSVPTTSASGNDLTVDLVVTNGGADLADYSVVISSAGENYSVDDVITIPNAVLETYDYSVGTGDLQFTVTEIYDDGRVPPYVSDDVVSQSIYEKVQVNFYLNVTMTAPGADGVLPVFPEDEGERTFKVEESFVAFVSGAVVEPGSLLDTVGAGGMPIGSNGSLLTTGSVVVTNNLFGPAA